MRVTYKTRLLKHIRPSREGRSSTFCLGGCGEFVDPRFPLCDVCLAKLYRLSALHCPDCSKDIDSCECTGIKVYSLFAYKTSLARSLIYGVKRRMTWENASFWARLLVKKLAIASLSGFEAVVAVPSRKRAIRKYGYGHSEMLAIELAAQLNIPYAGMLYRSDNVEQKLLSANQRRRHLKNSFHIVPSETVNAFTGIKYKRILLLDDVTTTGDTLICCRSVIKSQGIDDITCITLAKTVKDY